MFVEWILYLSLSESKYQEKFYIILLFSLTYIFFSIFKKFTTTPHVLFLDLHLGGSISTGSLVKGLQSPRIFICFTKSLFYLNEKLQR